MKSNSEINIDKFPDRKKLEEIIKDLKSVDLSKISYEKLFFKIHELIILFSTPSTLKAGQYICRGRINEAGQIFYSEREISYQPNNKNIKEFGRANCPGQPLFYGAIPSGRITEPRLVALFETFEILRAGNKLGNLNSFSSFVITTGIWKIKNNFQVADIIFNKQCIENIPEAKEYYKFHVSEIKKLWSDRADDIIHLLEFISDEFAKKRDDIKSDSDYKISVAYTEIVLNMHKLFGVVYPSVSSDLQGYNIALTIPAVEIFLELEQVNMFNVSQTGHGKLSMVCIANAKDLGPLKSNFKWEYINYPDSMHL
jgi:hypothetical protein